MANMEAKSASSGQHIYEDIAPPHKKIKGEGTNADIIIIHITGFRKEQIRIVIDKHGKLRVSGERPVGDNKWIRFRKILQTPENCNYTGIRAKFENERVYINLPKIVVDQPAQTTTQDKPATEPKLPSVDQNGHTKPVDAQNKVEDDDPEHSDKDSKSTSNSDSEGEAELTEPYADQKKLSKRRLLVIKLKKVLESVYGSRKAICGAFAVLVISVGVGLIYYQ